MVPSLSSDHARLPYLPAVDGLRGLAVVAVLLYHSDFTWARGGHLGVTTFFVLSGFLITALLLLEHDRDGRIDLGAFWARRARRLVPAALLAVALIAAYLAFGTKRPDATHLGDGIASLFWVANWRFIADGASYADLFAEPSPFRHFWSLAVEEQFYLLLPLVVVGTFALCRDRSWARWSLAAILGLVVLASSEVASLLHEPGEAPLRAYYGTDARIAEPALGALLALALVGRSTVRQLSPRPRRLLDAIAIPAGLGLLALMTRLDVWNASLYDGGFLVTGLLACAVIAASTQASGVVARFLRGSVLTSLGQVSYGVYLFHWPIFLWLDERSTGSDGLMLLAVRVVTTVSLAAMSYAVLELPIREGRLPRGVALPAWSNAGLALMACLALVTGTVSGGPLGPAAEVASGAGAPRPASGDATPRHEQATASDTQRPDSQKPAVAPVDGAAAGRQPTVEARPARAARQPADQGAPVQAPAAATTRVAVLGDSLAADLAIGLKAWAKTRGDVEVLDLAIRGCPISRGGERQFPGREPWRIEAECGWWEQPDSARWESLVAFRPTVLVVHDALNEIPDRKRPEWPTYMHPGMTVFDGWLVGEYRSLTSHVESALGVALPTLFVNAPCAAWERIEHWSGIEDADERVDALNTRIYRELAVGASTVIDLYQYLCPDDHFTDDVDGVRDARPDGFHLSEPAAVRTAEQLLVPAILSPS